MTISAQAGVFSYGMQTAKSTENVLDTTQVKANVSAASVAAVATPASPAVDSRIVLTVDVALGAGDCSVQIIGQDAAGDYQSEVVTIPALSVVGTQVWTSGTWNASTGVTSISVLEASAAGQFDIGAYDSATGTVSTWYRHLASDINFGPVQDLRTFPLEVGGTLVPTGGYKAGVFVGGGATVQPRMEGDFGWLLKGLMGDVATTGPTDTTAYTHVFKFATDESSLPWMGVRKYIPGPFPLGEVGTDCKITSVRFNFPQNGIIQARVDFLGREPALEENPSWTYDGAFENFTSVPVTCTVEGLVKFPAASAALPITSLVIMFSNNLTSPQQEMIIGSPYPDDFVPLSRAMTIQATLKWANPDLYQAILTNSTSGTTWDPEPYTTDFQATVTSPSLVTGAASTKYTLTIDAENVMWNVAGPPSLAGGDIVMLPLIGTVLEPTSGEYATFTVINAQAAY